MKEYSRCTGLPLMIICTMMNASKGCHCGICVARLLVTHLHRMRPTGTRPIGMLEFQLLGHNKLQVLDHLLLLQLQYWGCQMLSVCSIGTCFFASTYSA